MQESYLAPPYNSRKLQTVFRNSVHVLDSNTIRLIADTGAPCRPLVHSQSLEAAGSTFPTHAPFRRAAGRPSLFNAAASSRAAHYPRLVPSLGANHGLAHPDPQLLGSKQKTRSQRPFNCGQTLPAPGSRVAPWSRPRPIRDAPDSRRSPLDGHRRRKRSVWPADGSR